MELDSYQNYTRKTAAHGYRDGVGNRPELTDMLTEAKIYSALALSGEAGEVCGEVKKIMRRGAAGTVEVEDAERAAVGLELGDVLWYVAKCADEFGFSLEQIARMNIAKLDDRRKNGKK